MPTLPDVVIATPFVGGGTPPAVPATNFSALSPNLISARLVGLMMVIPVSPPGV